MSVSPIEPSKRIVLLDVLRGVAIFGILFSNILYFSGYNYIPFTELNTFPGYDNILYKIFDVIITGKFYTLFSLLFGVGFYIQYDKKRNNPKFIGIYRRRLWLLVLIGLFHSLLIWYGDILLLYGVMGFILVFYRYRLQRKIWMYIISILFFFVLYDQLLMLVNIPVEEALPKKILSHVNYPDMPGIEVLQEYQKNNLLAYYQINTHNLLWKWASYFINLRPLTVLGLFLLGFKLASTNFFKKAVYTTKFLIVSGILGILFSVTAQLIKGNMELIPPTYYNILFKSIQIIGQIALCFFYVSLVARGMNGRFSGKILSCFTPVGRMALTCYVLQSIIAVLLFSGLNLMGKLDMKINLLITLGINVFLMVFSNLWLQHYRFGPLEWAWRCLTYKKYIPLKEYEGRVG